MSTSLEPRLSESVALAKQFIEQNYSTIQSVTEVADHIAEPYNTLRLKFPREMKCTLEDYLIGARLRAAEELLLNSNLSVKEISWKVGYRDEAHFCKLFKEVHGATVKTYRHRRRFSFLISRTLGKLRKLFHGSTKIN